MINETVKLAKEVKAQIWAWHKNKIQNVIVSISSHTHTYKMNQSDLSATKLSNLGRSQN